MEGKPIIVQQYSWKIPDLKNGYSDVRDCKATKASCKKITDCKREWSVNPEYKDSDLPHFHILGVEKPIQTMNYN